MKYLYCLAILLFSINSHSAVHCSERVTSVILHLNSNLYFKTDKTCSKGWCQIKWEDESNRDRALSVLLAARISKENVAFYWQEIDECSEINVTYASPGYFAL